MCVKVVLSEKLVRFFRRKKGNIGKKQNRINVVFLEYTKEGHHFRKGEPMERSMLVYQEVQEQMLGVVGVACSRKMTRKEIEEIQDKFRKQREAYERVNGTFMSEERKKALYK